MQTAYTDWAKLKLFEIQMNGIKYKAYDLVVSLLRVEKAHEFRSNSQPSRIWTTIS